MTEIEIAPARPLDAGQVGQILSVNNERLDWLPRLHSAAEDIRFSGQMIDAGWVRVAQLDARLVGFIARRDTEILALYVLPEAQGNGVGSALLDDARAECDALALWTYEANRRAVRFYENHGFAETRRTDGSGNEAGLPDIRFRWEKDEA